MKRIIFALLIISLLLGTGCGKKNKTGEKTAETAPKAETELSDGGGEISVYSYKPDTLCPILSANEANIQMLEIVYDGLVSVRDDMTAEPALSDGWTVSEDGLEWSFSLRGGVLWHSGELFGAEDVVYTVNTIKAHPESVYAYNVSKIQSVRTDGGEVRFRLTEPNPNFPNLMYFPIIRSNSAVGDLSAYVPVGTGAYRFEDRNEGNIYYLVRNDSWWGGKADNECIRVRMLPDRDTALYAFSSGNIDMTATADMNWGKYVDASAVKTAKIKTPIYTFLGVNHSNSFLKETEVRAAISKAVDRSEIVSSVMMDYAVQASAPIRGDWAVGENQTGSFKASPAAAKEFLEESGWTHDGSVYKKRINKREYKLKFDILINDDNTLRENTAEIIEKNLEEFGIAVSIVKLPYDEYAKRIESGKYDLFIGSIVIPADLSADFILGGGNCFGFEDAETADVLEKLKKVRTDEEKKNAYAEMINLFEQINPVIGLYFEDNVMITSNRIKGDAVPSYYDLYRGIEKLRRGTNGK